MELLYSVLSETNIWNMKQGYFKSKCYFLLNFQDKSVK